MSYGPRFVSHYRANLLAPQIYFMMWGKKVWACGLVVRRVIRIDETGVRFSPGPQRIGECELEQTNCFVCVENRKAEACPPFRRMTSWGRTLQVRRDEKTCDRKRTRGSPQVHNLISSKCEREHMVNEVRKCTAHGVKREEKRGNIFVQIGK